jgi:hypothetical protein
VRLTLRQAGATLLGVGVLLVAIEGPVAAQVHVALTPTDTTVTPGDTFVIRIVVTQPGSNFNAYDATVGYDAGPLTFLPTSPTSLQEGSYMRNACGNTFHLFRAEGDSMTITHVLLCDQTSLPGPGILYRLRFQASTTPQDAHVRFRALQFYNAGFFVNPALSTDALIHIGIPSDAEPPPSVHGLGVRAAPNPFNPITTITVEAPRAGLQSLLVHDVTGRCVRTLQAGTFPAGRRSLVWDGRDDRGAGLASGVYVVVLENSGGRASQRVVLVK